MVVGQLTMETDIAVIGGGPGGYVAAIHAAGLDRKVILVDERDRLGGVCLLEGCIPARCLLHAAGLIESSRTGAKIGIDFPEPKIDLDRLRGWMNSVVDGLSQGVDSLVKNHGIEILKGHARFMDNRRIAVEGAGVTVEFKHAIIATGSTPPEIPAGYPPDLWSPSDALRLSEIPQRLLVITNEYYGFEIAQVYASLGSKVTIADFDPELLEGADKDLTEAMLRASSSRFEAEITGAKIIGIQKDGVIFRAQIEDKKGTNTLEFDRVLIARSRRPNTFDLMLEKTKIVPDEKGFIPIDDQCRTSEPKMFAVGDATPGPMLAFKAARQAKVATEVIAGLPSALDNRAIPGMVFTDPEIAWTGLTERSAARSGAKYSIAKFPLTALGEAHILGRAEGFVKVLYDPDSKLLLGAGMVGPRASEVISQITLAIEMGATLEDLAISLQPHPTMSESFMETVEVALRLPTHVFRKKSR